MWACASPSTGARTASRRCSCISYGTGSTAGSSSSGSDTEQDMELHGRLREHRPTPRLLPLIVVAVCLVWLPALTTARGAGRVKPPASPPHRHLALFSHSENCVACHNSLMTPAGEDVSIGATWRSTMMANSARDPYWQAGVRRETIDHPTHAAAIQDECAGCHMPMATRIVREADGRGEVFSHLPLNARSPSELRRLAADGVSCTVCHQISSEHLGTRESFNGEFAIKPTPASGVRQIFGPYQVDAGRTTIMRSVTGFAQEEAPHIKQ